MPATSLSRPRRRTTGAFIGISLAYFMVLLDTTVLAVAEPDIMSSLHTDVVGVGWATTAYTVTLAATLVLAGSLTDRLGGYGVFMAGVGGFGIASMACAGAPDLAVLVACRGVLGVFAAAIIPSSLRLIASLYPEPGSRGRAIGAWAAISGAAMAAGPLLGGWLIAVDDWRAVFVINAPIAAAVLTLCRRRVPSDRHQVSIDPAPHVGLGMSLAALTLAITAAGRSDWAVADLVGVTALLLATATAALDRRSPAPLVPPGLRTNGAVWVAFGWGASVNYALTTVVFAVPLLLHRSPVGVGVALLPMTLLIALNPLLTGRLMAVHAPLLPITAGLVALPAGLGVTAIALGTDRPGALLAVGLFACGLGVSWTLPALVLFAVSHAPHQTTGAVGGILNATRQVGATMAGAAAMATLGRRSVGPGIAAPFVVAAVLCAAGLVGVAAVRAMSDSRQSANGDRDRLQA